MTAMAAIVTDDVNAPGGDIALFPAVFRPAIGRTLPIATTIMYLVTCSINPD